MADSVLLPIETIAGVQPSTDATPASTRHYTFSDKIRVRNGRPEKLGGWASVQFDFSDTMLGYARSIFTESLAGKYYSIIGTHSNLYSLVGSALLDITPVGLPAGLIDETSVQGYGAGLYGVGLYGTAVLSTLNRSYPRIWFSSRYGDTVITTPGNQTGVYVYDGSNSPAVLLTNAPTEVNYSFVSDGIVVTFGADNVENRIFASDQNNITNWTAASENQVFDDDVEGAGRLIAHCPISNGNLIFTEHKTYSFRKISGPLIWEIKEIDASIGLIAPMAVISVNGTAYWMSESNFHYYNGGQVKTIPSNSQPESTILNYVFGNLNFGQKSKTFAWYNKEYNEIWFHYPSAGSNEPDRVARLCLTDNSWWPDTMNRTGAEKSVKLKNPLLLNVSTLYKHEIGNDDDGDAMTFTLHTDKRTTDKNSNLNLAIIPDSEQTGDITVNLVGYMYPQSVTATYDNPYTVTPTTERIATTFRGRFWQYKFTGSAVGQSWRMGQWYEEKQKGAPKP